MLSEAKIVKRQAELRAADWSKKKRLMGTQKNNGVVEEVRRGVGSSESVERRMMGRIRS